MGRKQKKQVGNETIATSEVEVGKTWKLQTEDAEKTAEQFKADTGHELKMDLISGNVYQVTILCKTKTE